MALILPPGFTTSSFQGPGGVVTGGCYEDAFDGIKKNRAPELEKEFPSQTQGIFELGLRKIIKFDVNFSWVSG